RPTGPIKYAPLSPSFIFDVDIVYLVTPVSSCLQVLGRGNCFDDIPQMGGMSEPTAQRVFHLFTRQFSRTFYSKWVPFPEGETLARIMKDYDDLGFPGAMGSTDVTHIHWAAAPHTLR
ncbi:unnamed protein product, partial [Scytosiphon promiscuus]